MSIQRMHYSITSVDTSLAPKLPRAVSSSRPVDNVCRDKKVWAEYTLANSPPGRFHIKIPAAKWTDANRTQLLVERFFREQAEIPFALQNRVLCL